MQTGGGHPGGLSTSLDPSETSIRDLILDSDNAEILWNEGSYPAEAAASLASLYREMDVEQVESPVPDRVVLDSTAGVLLTVVKQGDTWRVDAGPLIQMRQKVAELQQQEKDEP